MDKEQLQEMIDQCRFPGSCRDARLLETHISWIALSGEYAFKIKRPVKYSFLDFSSPEKRNHYCREEVKLNRRLAPDMYLGVLPLTDKRVFGKQEKQDERVLDYAVQMKRMDREKEMDRLLQKNGVSKAQLKTLAQKIARFHQDTQVIKAAFNTAGFQEEYADILLQRENIVHMAGKDWGDRLHRSVELSAEYLNAHRDYLNERVISGFQRDGHGDFNASNVFLYDDPVIFDCIEFSEKLRHIDVLNEIAFLCVDLDFYSGKDTAGYFYRSYLEAFGTSEDADSKALFTYYKSYRANVRAKVSAIGITNEAGGKYSVSDLKKYLQLMWGFLQELP